VLAVRLSDGKELWRHDVADPESSPAIGEDGTVYIGSGFNGNAVVALRSETDDELNSKKLKRELWRTPAKYPITGPVTLVNDLVIIGGGNEDFVFTGPNPAGVVLALDRKTGSIRWEVPTEASVLSRVVHHNAKLFCPVRNGHVVALNAADGAVIWKQQISATAPLLAGPEVSADGTTVFAVSADGYLHVLSAVDGKPIEKHPLNSPKKPAERNQSLSTPTLQGNMLYVGSETGGLRSFQLLK
jgi:outer membrane protein assembly factor BamB